MDGKKQTWKEVITKGTPKIISTALILGCAYASKFFLDISFDTREIYMLIGLGLIIISVYMYQIKMINDVKNDKILEIFNQFKHRLDEHLEVHDKANNRTLDIFGHFESRLAEYSDWFYSHDRLSIVEKEYCNNNLEYIWVASSNLEYEKENSPFINAIRDNLKEGINYYYLIPKSKYSELKIYVQGLINYSKNTEGKITFIPVKDNSLFLFLSNIVIYKDDKEYPTAFRELNIDRNLANRGWVKVDKANPDFGNLYSKFQELVEKS